MAQNIKKQYKHWLDIDTFFNSTVNLWTYIFETFFTTDISNFFMILHISF